MNKIKDNIIIFTTAYKDINRKKWNCYQRSNEEYIKGFYNLCSYINYKLIVYLEDDIKEIITKGKIFNENIFFISLKDVVTFYDKYLEKDKKIMETKEYQDKIPYYRKANPEHIYSEYNFINHSKVNFIRHTKDLFPDYKFYAWIDFGTMNLEIENIPMYDA